MYQHIDDVNITVYYIYFKKKKKNLSLQINLCTKQELENFPFPLKNKVQRQHTTLNTLTKLERSAIGKLPSILHIAC